MSDIAEEALQNFFALSCPEWQKDYIILENDITQTVKK
jgi:hypothetical protein